MANNKYQELEPEKTNSKETKDIDPRDVLWKLFEKTKDINFYRLYSAINNEREDEDHIEEEVFE